MYSPKSALLHGLLIVTIIAVGCSKDEKQQARDSQNAGPVVRVAKPISREITDYAYFTGRTESPQSVKVQARVTGYLVEAYFEEGAEVKAGEPLFLIDPRPYQAALDRALGQVQLTEAQLKLAKADYARALEIAKTPGAISRQDVDKYAAARDEAVAAVAAAKANSESARLNLGFTRIESPVDGVVGRFLLTTGNLIKQDQSLLTTVVSQDPMYVYFDVDEQAMLRIERMFQRGTMDKKEIKVGFPVDMGLADEGDTYPHQGKIDYLSNQTDPGAGTRQVRGVFFNPPLKYKNYRLLTPGMFVRVRLPIGLPHDAILVPQKAVGIDQGKKYLKIVNEKNIVEYRPITLGAQQSDGLQVVIPVKMVRSKDGLKEADEKTADKETIDSIAAGERVIVGGLQFVHAGMKVRPKPVESENQK